MKTSSSSLPCFISTYVTACSSRSRVMLFLTSLYEPQQQNLDSGRAKGPATFKTRKNAMNTCKSWVPFLAKLLRCSGKPTEVKQ